MSDIVRFTYDELVASQDIEHNQEFILYDFYYDLQKNNTSLNQQIKELKSLIRLIKDDVRQLKIESNTLKNFNFYKEWLEKAKEYE